MDLLVKPSARNQLRELCMVHSSEYALIYRPGDRVLSWSIEKKRYVASSIVVTACAQGLTVRHRWKKGQSFFLSPTAHHRIWIHSGQQFRLVHLVPKLQFKPGDRLSVSDQEGAVHASPHRV